MTITQVKKPRRARRRKPKVDPVVIQLPEGTNLTKRKMTEQSYSVTKEEAKVVLPKPTDNIIPLQSYVQDAKNRWKIHQYEIEALSKDIRWGYNKAKPFVEKVIARISPKGS